MQRAACCGPRKTTLSPLLHYTNMSNDSEPRSSPDLPESERTNKPLIIECDYNTRRQNLAFDSARDCSCDELRARVLSSPLRRTFCTEHSSFRSRRASSSLRVPSRCDGTMMTERKITSKTKTRWTTPSSTTILAMEVQSPCSSKYLSNTMGPATRVLLRWSEKKQTRLKALSPMGRFLTLSKT